MKLERHHVSSRPLWRSSSDPAWRPSAQPATAAALMTAGATGVERLERLAGRQTRGPVQPGNPTLGPSSRAMAALLAHSRSPLQRRGDTLDFGTFATFGLGSREFPPLLNLQLVAVDHIANRPAKSTRSS